MRSYGMVSRHVAVLGVLCALTSARASEADQSAGTAPERAQVLLKGVDAELTKGDEVEWFVIFVGREQGDLIFLINEFDRLDGAGNRRRVADLRWGVERCGLGGRVVAST